MPDEFKLRPFVTIEEAGAGPNCIALDAKRAYAFTITSREHPHDIGLANAAHEQGARALAAAIEARIMECRSMCYCNGRGLPCSRCGGLGEASGIIHRLVPPGAGKEKA